MANTSKKNQDIPDGISDESIGKDVKNLLSIIKSAKFKKPNLIKFNSFRTNFLILEAKETFINPQKAFTKAPILRHFDLKYYIHIETNTLEYAIGRVLSQITLD